MAHSLILRLSLICLCLVSVVRAQSQVTFSNAQAPYALLHLKLDKGYKTYYRVAGETGLSPIFDFSLSKNLGAAKVLWPAPQKFYEGSYAYWGYDKSLVLPLKLTALSHNEPIELHLTLEYGVCKDICIPQKTTQSLRIIHKPSLELDIALQNMPRSEQVALSLLGQNEKSLTYALPSSDIHDILVETIAGKEIEGVIMMHNNFTLPKQKESVLITFLRFPPAKATQLTLSPLE